MRFLTYIYNDEEKIGILTREGNKVLDLSQILNINKDINMIEFIEIFNEEYEEKIKRELDKEQGIDIENIKIQAPIPNPKRGVICLGKNYKEHVKEVPSAMDLKKGVPENPVYFCKFVDRAVAHKEAIPAHSDITEELDYEVELAVVIGKEGKNIPKDKVKDYIFGYTILNDISVRNLQTKHVQWFRGKCLDGTCPMGPHLLHKSEVKYPVELDIKCYVNDELRQNANTREMIFDIDYIISDFSKGTTLKPGDIISTGTPSGVGMGFNPRKFLKDGDRVTCVVENIGELSNIILE